MNLSSSCQTGTTCQIVQCTRGGTPPPTAAPVPAPAPAPVPVDAPDNAPANNQENETAPEAEGDQSQTNGDAPTADTPFEATGSAPMNPDALPVDSNEDPGDDAPDTPEPATDGVQRSPYNRLLLCSREDIRVRKEIRAMSDDEWNRFVDALRMLKNRDSNLRGTNVNQFEDLALLHSEFVEEAHGGSYFLVWHRLFIFLLESLLREIDPSVTLPYWNWAMDAADPAMSSVWNRLGGSVLTNGEPDCIPDGPWRGWWSGTPNVHCVRRGFTRVPGTFTRLENWFNVQNLINSNMSYSAFANTVESVHGSPHVGVGGDMGVLGTAPNDPVFFLHHCFVDYIYYRWQRNGTGRRGRFGGTNPTLNGRRASRRDMLAAFRRTIREGQGLNCVRYEDAPQIFQTASGEMNLDPVLPAVHPPRNGSVTPSSPAAVSNERARDAFQILQILNKKAVEGNL